MGATTGGLPWRPIMVLGDSILRGQSLLGRSDLQTFVTSWQQPLGWPLTLTPGYNQAVAGQTTTQILARTAAALLTVPNCWGVIIDGGVNDLAGSPADSATPISNLEQIIDRVHGAGFPVCFVNILPTTTLAANPARTTINTTVAAYLGANSRDFSFDTSWFNSVTMSDDGTHPNTLGCTTGATYLQTAAHAAAWI